MGRKGSQMISNTKQGTFVLAVNHLPVAEIDAISIGEAVKSVFEKMPGIRLFDLARKGADPKQAIDVVIVHRVGEAWHKTILSGMSIPEAMEEAKFKMPIDMLRAFVSDDFLIYQEIR
jgi:hypothetical protein